MNTRAFVFSALTASMLMAAPAAWGAATVLGSERAEACFNAAKAGSSHEAAIRNCTDALEMDQLTRTNRAGTLVNRGVMYLRQRNVEKALADFDAANNLAPEIGEVHVNRGAALLLMADYEGAVKEISLGLDLGAEDAHEAYYNRGLAFEYMGNVARAYYDYKAANTLKPEWELPAKELQRFTVTTTAAQ